MPKRTQKRIRRKQTRPRASLRPLDNAAQFVQQIDYEFSVKKYWPFKEGQRLPVDPGAVTARVFEKRLARLVEWLQPDESARYTAQVLMQVAKPNNIGAKVKLADKYWEDKSGKDFNGLKNLDKFHRYTAQRLAQYDSIPPESTYRIRIKSIIITVRLTEPTKRRARPTPHKLFRDSRGRFKKTPRKSKAKKASRTPKHRSKHRQKHAKPIRKKTVKTRNGRMQRKRRGR